MFKNISLQDERYIKRSYNLIKNIYEINIQELEKKGYIINVFCPSFKDMKNLNFFIGDYIDLYSYKYTNENFNYLLSNKNKKRFWHITDKSGKVFLYVLPSGKIFIEQFKQENIKYYDDLMTECYKEINFINLFINRNFYKNETLKKHLKNILNIL